MVQQIAAMQPTTTAPSPLPQDDRRHRLTLTAGYYAMFAAFGLTFAVLGPTLPGLAEQSSTGLREISYLFVARSGGSLLGSLLAGNLYDRLPGHRVLAASLAALALTLFLTPFPPGLILLTTITFLLGLAQGGVNVGGNALLVWVHGAKSAPYMSGLHFFFGIGSFVAPVIVAWSFQSAGDYPWAYFVIALLVLLPTPFLLRMPSPRLERSPQSGPAGGRRGGLPLLAGLATLFLLCYSGAANCFGGWVYTYAITLDLADVTGAAYLTSVFWGSLTLGRFLAIPLAMRFHPSRLLWADLAGALASLGLLLLLPGSILAVWLGSAGLGLSLASMFPVTVSMVGRSLAMTGKISALFSAGANLGALLLPLVVGQFFEIVGPEMLLYVLLVDMGVALVALAWMLNLLRPQPAA
jgi:MFS transporter, FHS family, Na+ dependent glucose transporter 1